MKIKLAILDTDKAYLNRLVAALNAKYSDSMVVYSFTDAKMAFDEVERIHMNILLMSMHVEADTRNLYKKCQPVYMLDEATEETYKGCHAIGKYNSVDYIYKKMLDYYAEATEESARLRLNDDSTRIILFTSPAGGVGTSSMAVACAKKIALSGKKVLYFDLDRFAEADAFFHGSSDKCMSDVIYSVKSKRGSVSIKLESYVSVDDGVCYYSKSKSPLDMLELKAEDVSKLVMELKNSVAYDYIVLDAPFNMDGLMLQFIDRAFSIVLVSDGSEIANRKLKRVLEGLEIKETQEGLDALDKTFIAYSKFGSKTGRKVAIDDGDVKELGGVPRFEGGTTEAVVDQMLQKLSFERLL